MNGHPAMAQDDGEALRTRMLVGAVAASLTLPVLVLGLQAPLWLALSAALLVLAGTYLSGRVIPPRVRAKAAAPLHDVLAEAAPALARLDAVAAAIAFAPVGAHAAHIAAAGREIMAALDAAPARLGEFHRVFTYYLPRAAGIAEAYALLEARPDADRARLTAIEDTLARLDAALAQVVRDAADDALGPLDVELRLMDAALRAELER